MRFVWPEMLWLTLVLPLLVLLYDWLLGRRKKTVLRHSSLALIKEALGKGTGWRRHLPPALVLAALGALVVAAARPMATITLPTQQQTIVMAMDVSGSMRATDVLPSRLVASQAAAKAFVAELPADVRIGVVAYAGTAHLVQAPTFSRDDVMTAIDRFRTQSGTAIGSGIVVSLRTLFPEADIDPSTGMNESDTPRGRPLEESRRTDRRETEAVPPGSYTSGAIVLLTDGQNILGIDPIKAARMAASRGVKVFTVGFGTKEGETIRLEGWRMRVRLDEDTLRKIADLTLGEYFHAGNGTDLKRVYEALKSRLVFEKRETEVTALFADAAALLVLLATGLSVWWFGRIA